MYLDRPLRRARDARFRRPRDSSKPWPKAPLFARVGQPLPARWKAIAILSWEDALNKKGAQHWKNQHLEAQGELTTFLSNHHPGEYSSWNERVRKWRPAVKEIVAPICAELVLRSGLGGSPFDAIFSASLIACMEYEYAHLRKPTFFHRIVGFYLAGHFPCGYRGWYPEGQHEVF